MRTTASGAVLTLALIGSFISLLSAPADAASAPVTVSIVAGESGGCQLVPNVVVRLGAAVTFVNTLPAIHSVVQREGAWQIPVAGDSSTTLRMVSTGTFFEGCDVPGDGQSIAVRLRGDSSPAGDCTRLVWATPGAPYGWTYDIQTRAPDTPWTFFERQGLSKSAVFCGPGTVFYRVRVWNGTFGSYHSAWSPRKRVAYPV